MSYAVNSINQRQFRRNRNLVRHQSINQGFGPITRVLMLVLIVGLLGLMYLTQTTKTNAYSYKLDSLQTKRDELRQENQTLAVEVARLKSIERTESVAKKSGFQAEAGSQVSYLR